MCPVGGWCDLLMADLSEGVPEAAAPLVATPAMPPTTAAHGSAHVVTAPAEVLSEPTVVRPGWRPALWKFFWIGLTSFGLGRQVYLYDAFVEGGWIPTEVFLADYAKTTVLPGAAFVNFTFMCGLRLRGIPMAVAGTALVFLPGTIAILLAIAFLSTSDPVVAAMMYGILVGAVALLVAMIVRMARAAVTTPPAIGLALGAMGLVTLNVSLILTILIVGTIGIWWYRPRAKAGPADGQREPDATPLP